MEKLLNLKWYVAIPSWYAIATIITFIMWYGIGQIVGGNVDAFTNPITISKIVCIISILFTAIILLSMYALKSSQLFWDRADIINKQIDDAETQIELNRINTDEFICGGTLRELASGAPHYQKMREMHAIILTKIKYVK